MTSLECGPIIDNVAGLLRVGEKGGKHGQVPDTPVERPDSKRNSSSRSTWRRVPRPGPLLVSEISTLGGLPVV